MKVLIVSSYKVSCGVAAYTESLETLLAKDFDVTVHSLDQSILKSTIPHVSKSGDRQIRELCAKLKDYDVVNLQWEPGLLGELYQDMARRLGWILEAAGDLILTVHTVLPYPEQKRLIDFVSFVRRKGLKNFYKFLLDPDHRYRKETYRILQERANADKKTYVAVHTDREKHFFRNVVGFRDVFDHPLSLVHADWPARLEEDTPEARRKLEDLFPGRHKFIGIFGFLSEYKGILTALRAMKILPGDYQLLIYGGVHPNAIHEREPVNRYVKSLMQEIEADAGRGTKEPVAIQPAPQFDEEGSAGASSSPGNAVAEKLGNQHSSSSTDIANPTLPASEAPDRWSGLGITDDVYAQSQNVVSTAAANKPKLGDTLMDKVAFLGSPDDYEFALSMSAVDVCVFPYLEVGQSGSGPVSIAVELGKPVIVSRTKAFIEFARYYPKHFEMIDIGNHIQLAQAIERVSKNQNGRAAIEYNSDTLSAFYGGLIRDLAGRRSSTKEPLAPLRAANAA